MKTNKYNYYLVIQQNYGQGWEDVSQYNADSKGNCLERTEKVNSKGMKIMQSNCALDAKEYQLTGYSTRIINRKELN